MFDVVPSALARVAAGEFVALATVIDVDGSAPRDPGTSMLVMADGSVVGSVSGGCVEGAVHAVALEVLSDGVPRIEEFGYSDADAFAIGLTCGGSLRILIERLSQHELTTLRSIDQDVEAGRPVAWITVLRHPDPSWVGRRLVVRPGSHEGSLGSDRADHAVVSDVRGVLAVGASRLMHWGPTGERMGNEMEVFAASFQPRPRMVIIGAVDFAAALASQAAILGFEVTVCDARPVFATPERFPGADEVVVEWPHRYLAAQIELGRIDRRTVVCVLTHDVKFDVPALSLVLELPDDVRPFYIGVMGSRRTHQDRLDRLREVGVAADRLDLLASPIGLDLRGRTPQETAVSIAAEIVACKWGGSGKPLRKLVTPIHAP